MKRIAFALVFALGLLIGTALEGQTPGTLLVRGEFFTSDGCLAFLNDTPALKKTGLCSFAVVAVGLKLPDLSCISQIVTYEDPVTSAAANDTVVNCTYSAVKKLPAAPNTAPSTKPGTVILTEQLTQGLSDGCLTYLNHPALHCGFNVVLFGLAVPNLTLRTVVSGGDTRIEGTYPPVKRMEVAKQ